MLFLANELVNMRSLFLTGIYFIYTLFIYLSDYRGDYHPKKISGGRAAQIENHGAYYIQAQINKQFKVI